jgi:hypothetical protein
MAKMIGKMQRSFYPQCKFGCCGIEVRRSHVKNEEERQWKSEAEEEIVHGDYCGDCNCPECGWDNDYGWLPNGFAEDLDDIEGVTTNMKRLDDYTGFGYNDIE